MKFRIPDSFEHAITIILAELGDGECARLIGKSVSLLRKASDPDQDFMLNLDQALALDAAYLEKTGETPPILRVWLRKLDLLDARDQEREGDIVQGVLGLQAAVGKCSEAVRAMAKADNGRPPTPNEQAMLLTVLDDVERQAINAKEIVRQQMEGKT